MGFCEMIGVEFLRIEVIIYSIVFFHTLLTLFLLYAFQIFTHTYGDISC